MHAEYAGIALAFKKITLPINPSQVVSTMQSWLSDRIRLDPAVGHGKPVVRGTRILVANIVGAMASGQSVAEVIKDHPSLKESDVCACLDFAARLTAMENVEA